MRAFAGFAKPVVWNASLNLERMLRACLVANFLQNDIVANFVVI
jgi:hypothetical protein